MRVPSPTTGTVGRTQLAAGYLQPSSPDLSGISRGLAALGQGMLSAQAEAKAKDDQLNRFKAVEQFTEFTSNAKARAVAIEKETELQDNTLAGRISSDYDEYETAFISGLPPELQDEFRMRAAAVRTDIKSTAAENQDKRIVSYQKNSIGLKQNGALEEIQQDPNTLETHKATIDELINNSQASEAEKFAMRQQNAMILEKEAYRQTLKRHQIGKASYMSELVSGTTRLASKYKIDPRDLLTVFSFETGGSFSTDQVGGKNNAHLGLIQFGAAEQKKYGVKRGMTPTEQLHAVEAYLDDRGFKPGMDIYQLYSTINAGSPGRLNASDAGNGGTPGTVADKVSQQMGGHKANADRLLNTGARIPITTGTQPGRQPLELKGLNSQVVDLWEQTQGAFGSAVPVVSAYRDPLRNKAAGGAKASQHMPGNAVDIDVSKLDTKERVRLIKLASAQGFTGIGVYNNSIHLDIREGAPVMWGPTHHSDSVPAWAFDVAAEHRKGQAKDLPTGTPVDFGEHKANGIYALKGEYTIPDTIDQDPRFINVPFEDRNAIRASVNESLNNIIAEQTKAQNAARKSAVDDLYNGLYDGLYDRADIDQAMKTGVLADFDERKKAIGILEEKNKDGALLKKAQERLASGAVFDSTDAEDKKLLNVLYGSGGTTALNGRDQEYVQKTLGPLFEQTGALPSEAVGTLGALSRSRDPLNMMYALGTLSTLENINPAAYGVQVPESTRHKVDLYQALSGTVPEKQLIEMLAEAPTSEARNTRDFYRKEAMELLKPSLNNPNPVRFTDQFGELAGEPLAPVTVAAGQEWDTLFTENYSRVNGNREAAITMTNKQFSRVWKKTQIDGADALMKYPPELYYPPVAGNFDWMTRQIRGELALKETERVFVVPDAKTADEVAKLTNPANANAVIRPSYLVVVQKEDGEYRVLRNAQGQLLRQTFVPSAEDKAQHEINMRIKSKEIELNNLTSIMSGVGLATGGMGGVPEEILNRWSVLKEELDALRETADKTIIEAETAYKNPSEKLVQDLEKQRTEILDKIGTSPVGRGYPSNVNNSPYADELKKITAALEKARADSAKEQELLRKTLE